MENQSIEELEALKLQLTEELRQNDIDLTECNSTIKISKDRETLERQRIIRLDLVENKKYLIEQLSEVKKNIKIYNNNNNNRQDSYADLMRANNEKLDKIILLLRRINKKFDVKKDGAE